MNRFRRWTRKNAFAVALAFALLFTQGVGLLHAVAHAGSLNHAPAWQADKATKGESRLFDARHSCASFDAATLAAAIHVAAFVALLLATATIAAAHRPWRSAWQQAARRFQARAPPFPR